MVSEGLHRCQPGDKSLLEQWENKQKFWWCGAENVEYGGDWVRELQGPEVKKIPVLDLKIYRVQKCYGVSCYW